MDHILLTSMILKKAKENQSILLLLLKICIRDCDPSHNEMDQTLSFLEKNLDLKYSKLIELRNSVINSSLRIGAFNGLILVIQPNNFKESNGLYNIETTSMGGIEYQIFIDDSITFGVLSIKMKEKYNIHDIIFVFNNKQFDLGDCNKKCIEHLTSNS
jgi:hypothetical protein